MSVLPLCLKDNHIREGKDNNISKFFFLSMDMDFGRMIHTIPSETPNQRFIQLLFSDITQTANIRHNAYPLHKL